jgi:hypothetical protein
MLKRLRWVKILFSPFKPFKVKCYVGKTQIGVPYFLPRKWVKATPERAKKEALADIRRREEWNRKNADSKFKHTIRPFEELYKENIGCKFAVPLKVGFSACGLGWKTKFDDYRYETPPVLSFVFFGYQIALIVGFRDREKVDAYWESWLYYEYETKGTKKERVKQCREKAPQIWTRYNKDNTKTTIDYYDHILKKKYLNK